MLTCSLQAEPEKRNSAYYVLTIFVVLAILSGFAFFVFLIKAEAVGERVYLVLTLMLTQVAFKFVTSGIVPRVGYNTHLDTYSLPSFRPNSGPGSGGVV